MTIREILKELNFVFFSRTAKESLWYTIPLRLEDKISLNFGACVSDTRNEIPIMFGSKSPSVFKHGHIHKVYCCLPYEYVKINPHIEKYRDLQDPYMYKYLLPEREFNSFLASYPIDIKATINVCQDWFYS